MVLAAGFFGINFGTIMLMLAFLNRASGQAQAALQRMFLYVGSMAVCGSLLLKLEYISRAEMHNSPFYAVVMLGTLGIIVALGVASRHRWGCTIVTGVYTIFGVAFLWILPLFSAQPKLGPVYHPVTHFIPWEFPLLMIVPAFVTDLLLQRRPPCVRPRAPSSSAWPSSRRSSSCNGRLRISDGAHRAELGLRHHLFRLRHAGDLSVPRFEIVPPEPPDALLRGLMTAAVISCVMAYAGILAGRAMHRVRR